MANTYGIISGTFSAATASFYNGINNTAAGYPTAMTVVSGSITAITKTVPVGNGTYSMLSTLTGGIGSITITNGVITAIGVVT